MGHERDAVERAHRILSASASGADPAADAEAAPPAMSATDRAAVVETAIQQAIRAGAFDNLPGAGRPLEGLGRAHDPDWWIRRKIETEQLSGLGPPALTLRVENRQLEAKLDRMFREEQVRGELEGFNRRIVEARRQLQGGPPVVTPLRDIDAEVSAWRHRRMERARVAREAQEAEERAALAAAEAERIARAERRRRMLRRLIGR